MKQFIIVVIVCVIAILLDKWLFEGVMASNMPDWVKYIILS